MYMKSKCTPYPISVAEIFVTQESIIQDSTNVLKDPIFNVSCTINAAAGVPTFELVYDGFERHRYQLLHDKVSIKDYGIYHNGTYVATIRFPRVGFITCWVNDARGSYNGTLYIDTTG